MIFQRLEVSAVMRVVSGGGFCKPTGLAGRTKTSAPHHAVLKTNPPRRLIAMRSGTA